MSIVKDLDGRYFDIPDRFLADFHISPKEAEQIVQQIMSQKRVQPKVDAYWPWRNWGNGPDGFRNIY